MTYAERHAAIVQYMHAKIVEKDWHGVSDAANDLREIEAHERSFREGINEGLKALTDEAIRSARA